MANYTIKPPKRKPLKVKKFKHYIMFRLAKAFLHMLGGVLILLIVFGYEFVSLMLTNPDKTLYGYKMELVQTGSMKPTLPIGSVVLIKEENQYNYGDIVNFMVDDQGNKTSYTHRISAVGVNGYHTKGDANNADDPWTINKCSINGKVIFSSIIVGKLIAALRELSIWKIALVIVTIFLVFFVIIPSVLFHLNKDEVEKEKRKKEVNSFLRRQKSFLFWHLILSQFKK